MWKRIGEAGFLTDDEKRIAAGYGARPAEAKFNPDQPRVPDGSPDGGQWTSESSGRQGGNEVPFLTQYAQAGFGILIAEIPTLAGRNCVYKFSFGSIIVPGPANFRCSPTIHSSAVTHGRFLNDN